MAAFLASPDAEYRIARWEQERDRCPIHGGPSSECGDSDRDWFPQRDVCWPAAQLAAVNRLYDLLHEDAPYHDGTFERWAKEPSREYPFHYRDGVTIWLSATDLTPDEDFLSASVPKKSPGDQDEADAN